MDQDRGLAIPHGAQHLDNTHPGRIHAHPFDAQIRTRRDARAHQEESRRGNVTGDFHRSGTQTTGAFDTDGIALSLHGVAEGRQHALGMVPTWRRLVDAGDAIGIQAGQQQAGFHLGAGHRHFIVDGAQAPVPTVNGERRGSTLAGFDASAHGGERRDDARHGPACQRRIAAQGHVEILTRENSRQQSHGGA